AIQSAALAAIKYVLVVWGISCSFTGLIHDILHWIVVPLMKQPILTLIILCAATTLFAQEPGGRGAGRGQAPQPIPLFSKETWKQAPGNVPVTQDFVVNQDLQLNLYG